ncbi:MULTISPECIES: oxygenase MpaB family protein [unclassified Leifsonia]|uniref:oxygenase MpaB family protein n=1 Tax=unclassified Leifsonia TaxID=2663824 RepID=UPI002E0E3A3E|nr:MULTISPECIES: oxygenase MpaB family protein [unclassified Leifsonia]
MPADATDLPRFAGDGVLIAGGARAILLQLAYPPVGRGVVEHSDFAGRPWTDCGPRSPTPTRSSTAQRRTRPGPCAW